MQQDHVAFAALCFRHRAPHDFVHARALPVIGIDLHADDQITLLLGQFDGTDLINGFRLGVHRVGGAEQQRMPTHRAGQQMLGRGQLKLELGGRDGRNVGMGKGVVADLVALGDLAAQQVRVQFAIDADDEERGRHARRVQGVENLRRVAGIRAVVESQHHLARRAAVAGNHVG